MLDDDFAFDFTLGSEENKLTQNSTFKKTTVSRNNETGEIQGWQEFYKLVCLDDPSQQTNMCNQMAKQKQAIEKWERSTRHTYVVLKNDNSSSTSLLV